MSSNALTVRSYEDVLWQLAERDDRIVVMTAENRAAIRGLPNKLGSRFIDVGICEQTMIGAAAGLALRGRIPVVHALAAFLTMRAFEFIRTDVGIAGLPVKLVGAVPGLLSEANGPTHQAIEDIALMRGIPGMEIVCPADATELAELLPEFLSRPNPGYLRFNSSPTTLRHPDPFAFGKAERLREGHDVELMGYGFLVPELVAAADILSERGVSTGVLNLRTLAPLDEASVLAAARRAKLLVTVEDHFLHGGLRTLLAELCLRHCLMPDVLSMGFDAQWFRPALLPQAAERASLSGARIAERVWKFLSGTPVPRDITGRVDLSSNDPREF